MRCWTYRSWTFMSEVSDRGVSHRSLQDIESRTSIGGLGHLEVSDTDIEVSDSEVSNTEVSDIQVSDIEVLEMEVSDTEVLDTEVSDTDVSEGYEGCQEVRGRVGFARGF